MGPTYFRRSRKSETRFASNYFEEISRHKTERGMYEHEAWEVLIEQYNSYTKETRAYHEKLVNTKMDPSLDPDDYISTSFTFDPGGRFC